MSLARHLSRLVPAIDEWVFNRRREPEMQSYISERLKPARSGVDFPALGDRPTHVVVVPMDGPSHDNFRPGGGNYFFEVAQSGREYLTPDSVSVFPVVPGEPPEVWQARLIRFIREVGATHLVAQVEKDPEQSGTWWWDAFWTVLEPMWDGVFIGVVFDSSYPWLAIPARRLGRISDRFLLVDICLPADGFVRRGRFEVGPVNMPVSHASLAAIDEAVGDAGKKYDISFIGVLYPYRVEAIEACEAEGIDVAVNPHRSDTPADLAASQSNQPGYVDYMRGLAQSETTINFARSSAGNFYQLKTRVLEACLMGCLVLTDDQDRTSRFWIEGQEFSEFRTPADLSEVVGQWLGDRAALRNAQQAARDRARAITISSFWGGIDDGLRRRSLRPLS